MMESSANAVLLSTDRQFPAFESHNKGTNTKPVGNQTFFIKGVQGMGDIDLWNILWNPDANSANIQASFCMRMKFQKWLAGGNTGEYLPEVVMYCLDKISNYAIQREITEIYLWEYTQSGEFEPIYDKILADKLLYTLDKTTYNVFIIAGKLYLRFLKEDLWEKAAYESTGSESSTGEIDVLLPDNEHMLNESTIVASVPPLQIFSPVHSLVEQLTDILSTHFTNGCRLNSPIELARFRSFAAEDLGAKILMSDEELKRYIAVSGTVHDDKVYVVSAQAKERIKELAEEYFADGAQVIFFAEFYAKNENWLFEASIVSEDMLISILRMLFPHLSFTQNYFGYADASVCTVLENEILRVWGGDILLNYAQAAERLTYVPIERIKYALGQNSDFIWNSQETFSHISRIDITEIEREIIREAAQKEFNAHGYVAIPDLPLGEIEERNYKLSMTALHNAVFHICLSDKFDKKGKIITCKGDMLNALSIMKDFCRTIDKCTLDDLLNYEKELTGEIHRWISMEAGYAVLVRIDKDAYVADRYVHFDSEAIDAAIELFIEGDYLPLKSFTTFGIFPDCGQAWNLFLLESYCRRFSLKFRFDAPAVNSRNAGAVIRKSCGLNYTEIMTDATAKSDIPLVASDVCKFLHENGYIGRHKTAKVYEIIEKAKAIRERRD
jgi:hypothetical protein